MRSTRLALLAPLVVAAVYACTGSDPDVPTVIHDSGDGSANGPSGTSSGGTSSGTAAGDGGDVPVHVGPAYCDSLPPKTACEDFERGLPSAHEWTTREIGGGAVHLVNDGGATSAEFVLPARSSDTYVAAQLYRTVATSDAGAAKGWQLDADMRLVAQDEPYASVGALNLQFDEDNEGDTATLDLDKVENGEHKAHIYGAKTVGDTFVFPFGSWHHVTLRLAAVDSGKTWLTIEVDGKTLNTITDLPVPKGPTRVDFGLAGNLEGGSVTLDIDNLVYRIE